MKEALGGVTRKRRGSQHKVRFNRSLSLRAKSRKGASVMSDVNGCAARGAARESGDKQVQPLTVSGKYLEMSRLRST